MQISTVHSYFPLWMKRCISKQERTGETGTQTPRFNKLRLDYLFKKSTGKKGITLEEAVEEAICFGWINGKLKRVDEERFMLRFQIRKDKSVWSQINRLRAEKLIADGKMTSAGLAKIEQAKNHRLLGKGLHKQNQG